MWVQGVGGEYKAEFAPNFYPLGTTNESIAEAKRMYTMAHEKCPGSIILAGGYRYV